MINSVSHIFLSTIFDAEEVYNSAGENFSISDEKFFIVGNTWIAIMKGEPLLEHSYNHVAFKVSNSEFDEYVSRINQLGIDVKPGRKRVEGKSRSIYFYDYDNHLFELHTGTLQDRLLRYSKTLSMKGKT